MNNIPRWLWSGIVGLLLGAVATGTIVIKLLPCNPSTSSTPVSPLPDPPKPDNLEDLRILVRDSKTKQSLKDVVLEITVKEGLIQGRTLDDGTYRFQVPKQKLGEFKVILQKQGYQQQELPINFSINPNEPKLIYLEPDSTQPPTQPPVQGGNPSPNDFFRVDIKPNKKTYTSLEHIKVEYSFYNVPEEYRTWINVIEASRPEGESGNYKWTSKSGIVELRGQPQGDYQIRAYISVGGQNSLVGRYPITVK
jgi:hypothetical protein